MSTKLYINEDLCKSEEYFDDDLDHTYSHMEGGSLPRYYWVDSLGNYLRYTNAPPESPDHNPLYGEPQLHPSSIMDESSQSLDGRKLFRKLHPGAEIQWNQSYHPEDFGNLWVARWVNPLSKEHEYTYLDADVRNNPKLKIFRQNLLFLSQLSSFREYVRMLFTSEFVKDKIIAIILTLLDQGKFDLTDLLDTKVGDVSIDGDIISFGTRSIHADFLMIEAIEALTERDPQDFLFMIPYTGPDGTIDYITSNWRIVGPNMVNYILDYLNMDADSFETFHASELYSANMGKYLKSNSLDYEGSHRFSLLDVAYKLGFNIDEGNLEGLLDYTSAYVIDPIIIDVVRSSYLSQDDRTLLNDAQIKFSQSVPHVTLGMIGFTKSEEDYFTWARYCPLHEYL